MIEFMPVICCNMANPIPINKAFRRLVFNKSFSFGFSVLSSAFWIFSASFSAFALSLFLSEIIEITDLLLIEDKTLINKFFKSP